MSEGTVVLASRLLDLADWHETKADKARRFPGPLERNEDVMKGKATVHDDAARRLRELVITAELEGARAVGLDDDEEDES